MSVRSVITIAAVLIGVVAFATPAAADIAIQQTDAPSYALTAGRLWSVVAAVLGLIGVAIGLLARTRRLGATKTRQRSTALGLGTGMAGAIIGGVVVAVADGGPGSGSGIVGGYMALLIGLLAILLGGLTLNQLHRTDPPVRTTSRA